MMKLSLRIVLTIVVMFAAAVTNMVFDVGSTLAIGKMAGAQFQPSDTAYIGIQSAMGGFRLLSLVIGLVSLTLLVMIWWDKIRPLIKFLPALMIAAVVLHPAPSKAYYADSDYAETFMILPNESAFWLPDVGDNKSAQVAFGSEEYYKANKIAAKRFDVTTHVRLPNSGIFANKYVSPGRLIKVDRSPTAREWVKASHRGTGAKDESFPCQSSEGLDVTVGVSIGTSVKEENAPKFLYTFGVNPPKGDPNDPNVVFTSVYYGKSLSQVMDEKVRPRVQSLVCDEVTKRSLDTNNKEAASIMEAIQKKVADYAASVGITLDFIGWADTFEFDGAVQAALNRRYIASNDLQVAKDLGPFTATLQALATAEATRTVAGKWNGAVPSSVSLWWLPSSISDWMAKAIAPADKK